MSAADGAIDAPKIAVETAGPIELKQQGIEDPGPSAVLAPAVEAIIDRLPGAVTRRRIRPGGPGMQMPEDAVDQRAMVVPRVTGPTVVVPIGEEGGDPIPLGVCEIEAVHGWPPLRNLPVRKRGSTSSLRESTIVRNDLVLENFWGSGGSFGWFGLI